ncbi:endothelin-converting enzyme, putative [Pediculus humanus corporis]|uniref:Endothelin-converting enzyme, putative n=1 Tax=Pediculus humanus subsp. corporis TaxID=121224 RepID=E0VEJ7_PEDHC|nr:endothelin-converting enzyme, putative [Pediculus humanus corporis]EEB11803.1 endothelin-converting enzyme, putative [Pediculus humanus corporis]
MRTTKIKKKKKGKIRREKKKNDNVVVVVVAVAPGVTLWKSRSKLEKSLLVIVGILVLLIFIFITILSSSVSNSGVTVLHIRSHNKDDVCLKPNCIKSAAHIISSLDLNIDPCDDFYQFSCGGWVAENPVPDGKSIWGTFGKLEQQNQLIIKHILEKPSTEFKSDAEKKAKIYYESCLDSNETIERLGAQPMLDLLNEVGGWNLSGPFNLSNWSLQKTLHLLHNEYNMGGLFSWAVGEDDKNSSRYVIQIDQGGLTLPTRENYLNKTANKKVLDAYLDYMTKVGVLLGGNLTSTQEQMKNVIEFETKLAEITQPEEDLRDEMKLYHLMSIADLQKKAPFMSWQQYFANAMEKVNRPITSKEMVVVHAPEYLQKVSNLVVEYMKTDDTKITLNNYLVWQMVRSLTCCLPKAFRDAHKGLRKALMGSDGGEEPWLSCITDTNNVIGFAIGAMFVRQVFQGNSKTVAENMISEIRNAFLDNLKNLTWMDKETRMAAINKANAITDMIGFPEFILNPQQLDEKYKDLEIKENEYFMNNIRVNQYNLKKNIERLDQIVNKTRWDMTPSTVNAYYTPTKNQIVFPAGILRSPFYDVNHSSSLNFGSMGVVMGHELTHAFDDLGREYDQFGNLHKWWKNETIDKFKEKTNCVVKQYSNYEINGRHLNGKQTLGENIADNGGLKAAYHAYLKQEQNESDLPLPGLNLTHKQLFFLSFAQVWCSSSTAEATLLQIEKDPHSPSKFRVIGPLSNLREFSKEFNCPPGSKMNPIEKCDIW